MWFRQKHHNKLLVLIMGVPHNLEIYCNYAPAHNVMSEDSILKVRHNWYDVLSTIDNSILPLYTVALNEGTSK
ncbi:hypothetical protein KSZ_27390 [Dictyobacter formicarum]|uniref:Uncharacterized protein n=1 Tax=Dictyobacter formicarum TaxID=2778368 RepID=A0ABQ3VFX9_9CHLR|nr:hypothetical protein KSZ_27390 [Dictyobacter formicarum]